MFGQTTSYRLDAPLPAPAPANTTPNNPPNNQQNTSDMDETDMLENEEERGMLAGNENENKDKKHENTRETHVNIQQFEMFHMVNSFFICLYLFIY